MAQTVLIGCSINNRWVGIAGKTTIEHLDVGFIGLIENAEKALII